MSVVTVDDVRRRIAELLAIPDSRAPSDAVLTDLVSDSFRLVELAIELQDHYEVMFGQDDMRDVRTVGDLAAMVRSRLAA
ncbi:MAG TPA: acyl carrier protein [Egibacteraceae bacterium]|nr:acyl carrier protein [Egibacteraceae bacterium]